MICGPLLFGISTFLWQDGQYGAYGGTHTHYLEELAAFPTIAGILLFWSGPIFPLSLLVLGIVLVRTKAVPSWAGVLISISGITFPLSRIPRVEWIAHVSDLLMFVPFCYLGLVFRLGKMQAATLKEV